MKSDTKIQYLKGVGPKMAAKLNKLGIETVQDLIFYYPRTYRDFTHISKIADMEIRKTREEGREITIRGRVLGIKNKKTSRRRFTVTEAIIEDGTGSIKVVWFNQPFLLKMLPVGREVILNGKITFNFYTREVVMESPERALYPKIEPVYGETAGLTSKYISKLVASVKYLVSSVEEWLPSQWLASSKFEALNSKQTQNQNDKNWDECSVLEANYSSNEVRSSHPADSNNRTIEQFNNCSLLGIQEALLNIHFPKNSETLEKARRRIAFDELFMISLRANLSKKEIKKEKAQAIATDTSKTAKFIKSLPFVLTGDQKKAAEQMLQDLAKNVPMNRLLNGDVGSGKTVVAAIAAHAAVNAGFNVAVMAPTEILAQQHFKTFCGLFKDMKVSVGLFTANCKDNFQFPISNFQSISNSKISKKEQKRNEVLNSNIIIGTQALIQEGIELENLGLVVVDEQHRFGVKQRAVLNRYTTYAIRHTGEKMKPHFLSMTATPIPRTLHLALFGDLDISVIKEKPANRKEIKTRLVEPRNRDKAYEFVRVHIKAGRQAFVICPLIEEKKDTSDKRQETNNITIQQLGNEAIGLFEDERKTVKREYEKLQKIYPEYNIDMLHGRMKSKEKDSVMADFSSNKTQILVSTSVVEVGVDIPNATVMIIEDVERFGLAQIHQFRGRVGRAEHQSFCFLFSFTMSQKAIARLKALESTSDGFKLAEIDLEQRGPGAIFGTEQSGLLDLKMANFSDRELIEEASSAAKSIVATDPELKNHPLLKDKIADYLINKHLE